jgi:hypothetical protein
VNDGAMSHPWHGQPRRARLPIECVKFVDSVSVLVAKVRAFFTGLGVPSHLPEFERGLAIGPLDLGPPPVFTSIPTTLAFEAPDDTPADGNPHGLSLGELLDLIAIKHAAIPEDDAGLCGPTAGSPDDPDVILDPFVNFDPPTQEVSAYGFRCRGRGLPHVHKVVVTVAVADRLTALLVRDGKYPWHVAKADWETARRTAVRQHVADLILPIAVAYKKSQPTGA